VDAQVTVAIDIDQQALAVYRRNFGHPTLARTIESLPAELVANWTADLWWLSPPCQPYTRRGLQRDMSDPRAASLLAMLPRIEQLRPRYVALENVPGFEESRTGELLRATLDRAGYRTVCGLLCPTELGIPNRRRRFYLLASREPIGDWTIRPRRRLAIQDFLDPEPDAALWVEPELEATYGRAIDVVDPRDASACCACFTSAYGRSPIRSGSYLRTAAGLRRFSPGEILRLLGFPATFTLPPALSPRRAWSLLGNSLSVTAVRTVLQAIPELGSRKASAPLQHASKLPSSRSVLDRRRHGTCWEPDREPTNGS
jgi:site-specific DNA-cytosine methylase